MANFLDNKLREDLERLKKIRYEIVCLLTIEFVMISFSSKGLIEVFVIIGVSGFAVSTLRPLDAEAELWVYQKRSNCIYGTSYACCKIYPTFLNKPYLTVYDNFSFVLLSEFIRIAPSPSVP